MFDTAQDPLSATHEDAALLRPHEEGDLSTHTIDVNSLFDTDVYSTRSFDLRTIETTSFGKLLDALPLPALVVDQLHYIVFANQACAKIGARHGQLRGRPFTDLVAAPRDANRARALMSKTIFLLEKAFSTRQPRVAEVILALEESRIWSRLHLRTVRIGTARYVLAMIEDVTSEKTREKLIEREQTKILERNRELERQVRGLTVELGRTRDKLEKSNNVVTQLQEVLKNERDKANGTAPEGR